MVTPIFHLIYLLRTVSSWSSEKKIAKICGPFVWQFHKIVGNEPLQVEQLTPKLNLFWSVNIYIIFLNNEDFEFLESF